MRLIVFIQQLSCGMTEIILSHPCIFFISKASVVRVRYMYILQVGLLPSTPKRPVGFSRYAAPSHCNMKETNKQTVASCLHCSQQQHLHFLPPLNSLKLNLYKESAGAYLRHWTHAGHSLDKSSIHHRADIERETTTHLHSHIRAT